MKGVEKPQTSTWERWLKAATQQIVFTPDREAVERELRDHLEDKALELQRIFPQVTQQEAQALALEQMGQAEELAPILAQIHRPFWGYIWLATKILVGLALVPVVIELWMVLVFAFKIW